MPADDDLARLERLARLRETGALNDEEFERAKALLFQRDGAPAPIADADDNNAQPPALDDAVPQKAGKRRWPYGLAACLALAGAGGWALAQWSKVQPQEAAAANAGPAGIRSSAASAPAAAPQPAPSLIRALPAQRQVDLAFDAVFGLKEREIRVSEGAVYSYAKGKVFWADFGPVLIVEGSGEPYPLALGTLGLFYLREMPGPKFEEVRRWPDAVAGGMMGNPPQWKIRTDLADRPVIEATGGGVWQGYGCDTTTLTELTASGPQLLATFASSYSSEGAEGDAGQTYDGAIVNVVRGRSFDVRFTGTRTITQRFVRKGGEYVRVPGKDEEMNESVIPTC